MWEWVGEDSLKIYFVALAIVSDPVIWYGRNRKGRVHALGG